MTGARIIVSGYYGFQNTGDEAVLAGIKESFAERTGDVEITVLSADPDDTRRRHGLAAVNRMKMAEVRQAIRGSDLFLSGGGSLLQDTTSLRSVLYYLWVIRMALAERKPVMLYAQGIGPLRRHASRILTRMIADRARQITVRDAESAQLLREIDVKRAPVEVTADPAFALHPSPPERADAILAESGVPKGTPLIGFAPRPWGHPHPTPGEYAEAAHRLHADSGAYIVLLPMQIPGDRDLCEQIGSELTGKAAVIRSLLSPQDVIAITARFSALLAMRLHALIFAATAGTPLVALSYDPKVRSLMALLGQPSRAIELEGFSVYRTVELVNSAMAHAESTRKELGERAATLRGLALRNADLALALAGSSR